MFSLFAINLKLYLASSSSKSDHLLSHTSLQRDINLLHRTSSSWGLSFSVMKSVRMNFCRKFLDAPVPSPHFLADQRITDVASHKDLEVQINTWPTIHLRVRDIGGKATQRYLLFYFEMYSLLIPRFYENSFYFPCSSYSWFCFCGWISLLLYWGHKLVGRCTEKVDQENRRVSGFVIQSASFQLSLCSIKGTLIRADLI